VIVADAEGGDNAHRVRQGSDRACIELLGRAAQYSRSSLRQAHEIRPAARQIVGVQTRVIVADSTRLDVWRHPAGYQQCRLCHWLHTRNRLFGGGFARGAGEPGGAVIGDHGWGILRCLPAPRDRGNHGIVIWYEEHADRKTPTEIVRGRRRIDDPMQEIGIGGEQVEDEAIYDATSMAAVRIGCLPGNARNAVAMAAIAANTQADRKT